MKSKEKLIFMIAAGIAGVLILVVAALLYMEMSKLGKATQSRDGLKGRLSEIHSRDPFPSKENVARIEENWQALGQEMKKFGKRMGRGQVPASSGRTPLQWVTLLTKTQRQLNIIAVSNRVNGTESLSFGFDDYADGTPPDKVNVPRLSGQLTVIGRICRVLIDSGIKELNSVSRMRFEQKGGSGGHNVTSMGGFGDEEVEEDPYENLYKIEKFTFELKARESALMEVMNKIASHKMFMIVSRLDIQAVDTVVEPASQEEAEDEFAGFNDRFGADADADAEEAKPVSEVDERERSERLMSGPSIESPASVRLEVTVYRFLRPPLEPPERTSEDAG